MYRCTEKIGHLSFSRNLAGIDSWKGLMVREAIRLRGNFSRERAKPERWFNVNIV